jgi:putative spermidine/putrescine transport system substrate-binding protein
MRRRDWLAGFGAGALLGRGVPKARAQAPRDLTVVSFGGAYQDAQRDAVFRPWMTEREARMLEETWDGGLATLRQRAQAGTWDLVQVPGHELLIGCAEGLFERMDWAAIGGRDAYIPEAVQDCGVGASRHAYVLAWDRARLQGAPAGWADLFDLERFPGRRALRRGPRVTLEVALLADGVAPAELYAALAETEGQDRAFRRLQSIRAETVWWERGAQPSAWLAGGEVALVVAPNGRISVANAVDGRDFGLVWAQNLSAMDSWAILRGSPNRVRALELLAYAGRPAVQARLAQRILHGVTAREAAALIPAPVQSSLPTAPPALAQAVPIDEVFWAQHLEALDRRFEAWIRA